MRRFNAAFRAVLVWLGAIGARCLTEEELTAEISGCTAAGGTLEWPDDPSNWGTDAATWPEPAAYTVVGYADCGTKTEREQLTGDTQDEAIQRCLDLNCFGLMFQNGAVAGELEQMSTLASGKTKWRVCYTKPATSGSSSNSYSAYNRRCVYPTTTDDALVTTRPTTGEPTTNDEGASTSSLQAPAPESTTSNPDQDCEGEYETLVSKVVGCAETCGEDLVYSYIFVVEREATGSGRACEAEDGDIVTLSCGKAACPADCVGEWGGWSDCAQSCAAAGDLVPQTRTFSLTTLEANGGEACAAANGDVDTQNCELDLCPVDCEGAWGEWGLFTNQDVFTALPECPLTCGGYSQSRAYAISVEAQGDGANCIANDGEIEDGDCAPLSCPIDCVGEWFPWNPCDLSCGGGTTARTFAVDIETEFGGQDCLAQHLDEEQAACNTDSCPVNCVGTWSVWGECDVSCGGGASIRVFEVSTPNVHGGDACAYESLTEETRSCKTDDCPVDCVGGWGAWGDCPVSCGGSTQLRSFEITVPVDDGGVACIASHGDLDSRGCSTNECPVDCVGNWGAWGACPTTCGGSIQERTFSVSIPDAFGGIACVATNLDIDQQNCETEVCPIDCIGDWGAWTECPVTCGTGSKERTFAVTVWDEFGGEQCFTSDGNVDVDTCADNHCPVDCIGDWTPFTNCSVTCGEGTIERTFVIEQEVARGGVACGYEHLQVEVEECPVADYLDCPVHCAGAWTDFGPCTESCGVGSMSKQFIVQTQADAGGDDCSEDHLEVLTVSCNTQECPIDCVGAWGAWSDCPVSCSVGEQTREFNYTVVAQFGGQTCAGETEDGFDFKDCDDYRPCPIHCVGEWSEWDVCTASCNTGSQSRTFNEELEGRFGGDSCVASDLEVEVSDCNTERCPINCHGAWTSWSNCSVTCGGGAQARTFAVDVYPNFGGSDCDFGDAIVEEGGVRNSSGYYVDGILQYEDYAQETLECGTRKCPVQCEGGWTEWDQCTESCGADGSQDRVYVQNVQAAYGGLNCQFANGTGDQQSCPFTPCPVDCLGAWSAWSECSKTCGNGTNTRAFHVAVAALNGGVDCVAESDEQDSRSCFFQECPIDCVGAWGEWGDCSHSCGAAGRQQRLFLHSVLVQFGGAPCEYPDATEDQEPQVCNILPCPVDCLGEWAQWSDCDVTCGEGNLHRNFMIESNATFGGLECNATHGTSETLVCLESPCPIHCEGVWLEWSDCALSCFDGDTMGMKSRMFDVSTIEQHGGDACITNHSAVDVTECNTQYCPINCEGSWTSWTACPLSCGTANQTRRYIVEVAAAYGGLECLYGVDTLNSTNGSVIANKTIDVQVCNTNECPIDCVGGWSEYTECDLSCGSGERKRTFYHAILSEFGGEDCLVANDEEWHETCNTQPCPIDCVGAWGNWAECDLSCGTGSRNRTYLVSVPTAFGGLNCRGNAIIESVNNSACQTRLGVRDCGADGEVCCMHSTDGNRSCLSEIVCTESDGTYLTAASNAEIVTYGDVLQHGQQDTSTCNTQECPIDCEAEWTPWGGCSLSCNTGVSERFFAIERFANFGGVPCEFDMNMTAEDKECNTQHCPIDCQGAWSQWSQCSLTCGIGSQTRRFIHNRSSEFGGDSCLHEDDHEVAISCNTESCPVDCVGMWLEWGACTATCNEAIKSRAFHVNSTEYFGGAKCVAEDQDFDTTACDLITCPIDCVGEWSAWSDCPLTCGTTVVNRSFLVSQPPKYGGAICDFEDDEVDTKLCATSPCPVDCVGEWSLWSDCTKTCNSGLEFRTFEMSVAAASGGIGCAFAQGIVGNRSCNTAGCQGCTSTTACNYQSFAKVDDGSCTYPETFYGCEGACIAIIDACGICGGDNATCEGCTSENACNYDASAIVEDGSCTYAPANFNCLGQCIVGVDCKGTCGGSVKNDHCNVCGGDNSSCTGCLDGGACNFDSNALVSSGTCSYAVENFNCNGICIAVTDCTGQCAGSKFKDTCGVCGGDNSTCTGCRDNMACNYDSAAILGSEDLCEYPEDNYDCFGNCVADIDCFGVCAGTAIRDTCNICGGNGLTCLEGYCAAGEDAVDCNGDCEGEAVEDPCGVCEGDGSTCAACDVVTACNYDANALVNDSSLCVFPESALVNCEGKCVFAIDCEGTCNGTKVDDGCGVCDGDNSTCTGCLDEMACNYDGTAIFSHPDSCTFPLQNFDCAGACTEVIDCNGICAGHSRQDHCGVCNGDNSTCSGCLDADACSFDEHALVYDASLCVYPPKGQDCAGTCLVEIDCAGECGGALVEDACGVCDGNGATCYVAFGGEAMLRNIESGAEVVDLQARVSPEFHAAFLQSFHGTFDSNVPRSSGEAVIVLCGVANADIDATASNGIEGNLAWGFEAGSATILSRKRETTVCGELDAVGVEVVAAITAADVVCSGTGNVVQNGFSAVLGGTSNTVRGNHSVIQSGSHNDLVGDASVVSGGQQNLLNGDNSVIGGGAKNTLTSAYASILGGSGNLVISNYATILGGYSNFASARHAAVAGGSQNTAGGLRSVAMGKQAAAVHSDSLVLSFQEKTTCRSQSSNSINVCADSLWLNEYNVGELFGIATKRQLGTDEVAQLQRLEQQARWLVTELERQDATLRSFEHPTPDKK